MTEDGVSIDGPDTVGKSVLILVLAIGLVGYGAYDYAESTSAVRDSVQVDATITETGIETTATSGSASRDVELRPTVAFTYTYEEKAYTGNRIFPGSGAPAYDTESAARDVIAGYEANTTVTAYVDPANPDEAFLKNQVSNRPVVLVGIGLVMALFGGNSTLKNYRDQ